MLSEYAEKVHISIWNLLKILWLNWLQNFVIYCHTEIFMEMDAEINALQIRHNI